MNDECRRVAATLLFAAFCFGFGFVVGHAMVTVV